ncbi:MerR family transcriptional regulator [Bombilactobacillus folatiphilus]|uniref:MerR family transcriptional regulator n=1 Tax=Bombilactobacillus folatiphilus TaxID=2923362 RepID=A0ABY4P8E5_9LACO|nr:MerR family transcriptional regulator [Bombilactobacillus folatiphilus]UQS81917.1 MerR family transcriptional regulator [Bombilactobacillus folatiphilus]
MILADKQYGISEFSQIFHVKPSTLRYYEDEGLIKPLRTANNRRYYTQTDADWIKFLLCLKEAGLSIDELKQYVYWDQQGDQTITQRIALLNQAHERLTQQADEIQHHLQLLNDKITWYHQRQQGQVDPNEVFRDYLARLGHEI